MPRGAPAPYAFRIELCLAGPAGCYTHGQICICCPDTDVRCLEEGGQLQGAATSRVDDLTVLLADDQVPVRVGIRRAIEPFGLRVVAEAGNAADALRLALRTRPDICVVAAGLPGQPLEAVRTIKQALPETKIVITTTSDNDEDLFGALRAGADGYLPIATAADRLAHAIRGVAHGEAALPRAMTARLISEFRARGNKRTLILPATHTEVELTAREFEVLERLRKRDRTAEIAARLGISEVTVRRHVGSVLHKLGLANRRLALEMLEEGEEQAPRTTGHE
jgi:DNA-binding NarL/FixJ family response regulator